MKAIMVASAAELLMSSSRASISVPRCCTDQNALPPVHWWAKARIHTDHRPIGARCFIRTGPRKRAGTFAESTGGHTATACLNGVAQHSTIILTLDAY
jgi:hypothetical protein